VEKEHITEGAASEVAAREGDDIVEAPADPKAAKSIAAATALLEKLFEDYLSGEQPDILKQPSQPKSNWFQKGQGEPTGSSQGKGDTSGHHSSPKHGGFRD